MSKRDHETKVIPLFWKHDQNKPLGSIYIHSIDSEIDLTKMVIAPGWKRGDKMPMEYSLIDMPDILDPEKIT